MSDFSEVKALIEQQGAAWEDHHKRNSARLKALEEGFREEIAKLQRPSDGGRAPAAPKSAPWYDTKTKRPVPVFLHGEQLAALETTAAKAAPNIGRILRGLVMGSKADDAKELAEERKDLSIVADPDGGFTVQDMVASQWIDLLRAKMVLSQAGAVTVPMDSGDVRIARVTADPLVSWHSENSALAAANPTFGAVWLRAKTAVTLVKMSLELSQDSVNIQDILQSTIVNAMAGAIDSAGLVGVTTDAAAAPGGVFNLTGRNSVTSIGAPTSWDFLVDGMYELLADNVSMENVGAFIAHPAVWKKMRKLKTGISSDNTPLSMPEEIAKLPKLWTTAAPLTGGTTAKGVVADWRDLLFGVRKYIQVRVLQEAFLGSNLQIAVLAYARVDFATGRPTSFCTLEGITV